MLMRIDPPNLGSKTYELYIQELLAWREVIELREELTMVAERYNEDPSMFKVYWCI